MTDLDKWISTLGDDATFDEGAAERLERRLLLEGSPARNARHRRWAASIAFAGVAGFTGALAGAVMEVQQTPPISAMLPASQTGTVAALFEAEG